MPALGGIHKIPLTNKLAHTTYCCQQDPGGVRQAFYKRRCFLPGTQADTRTKDDSQV